jgi:hypothetical protein
LYDSDGWNLHRPQLILSVTGGAQKFNISNSMKTAFKRGLIKAAVSTGAWIITGGTNMGLMRLVGEAVADEFKNYNSHLTVLGIATWGKVALRDQMTVKVNVLFNTKKMILTMTRYVLINMFLRHQAKICQRIQRLIVK